MRTPYLATLLLNNFKSEWNKIKFEKLAIKNVNRRMYRKLFPKK